MDNNFNRQAIVLKQQVDDFRESQEAIKYAFYSIDNSEGAQIMMQNTASKGFFKARYLNPDALALRNSIFPNNN